MHVSPQVIIPAIIPRSYKDIVAHVRVLPETVREMQVDIVDGVFVPSVSWPYVKSGMGVRALREVSAEREVEVDLMVLNPETVIPQYAEAGVKKIVVHLESTKRMDIILSQKHKWGFALGLSIGNDTPLEALFPYMESAEYVQLMGIAHIGVQGNPFDERVLERITRLVRAYPTHTISVDGGVNAETIPHLRDAGATRLVSGSAVFGPQNKSLLKRLMGVYPKPTDAYERLVHIYKKECAPHI